MLASGYFAGSSQVSLAKRKLLCSSVGGTPRSSTQNRWTFGHANSVRAKYSYMGFGEDPPEIAREARPRAAIAAPRSSSTRAPHASAAAVTVGNVWVCKIPHDKIRLTSPAITVFLAPVYLTSDNGKQKSPGCT